jgi:hypothetical protein
MYRNRLRLLHGPVLFNKAILECNLVALAALVIRELSVNLSPQLALQVTHGTCRLIFVQVNVHQMFDLLLHKLD